MKNLEIRWQRFVNANGQACHRCESTEKALHQAFERMGKSLALLGIKLTLKEIALDIKTLRKDISQSNRVWVGERALEEWLEARIGESPCSFCGEEVGTDVGCRTLTSQGHTYETITENLIIKSSLLAAAALFNSESDQNVGA